MKPSDALKAGAALAAVGLAVALSTGGPTAPTVTRSPHGRHIRIGWAGSPPAGVECLSLTVRATAEAQARYGLPGDAGDAYVPLVQCAAEVDGGMDVALAQLEAGGVEILGDTEQVVPWDGGMPRLEAWAPGTTEPSADMCACSSGAACSLVLDDGGTTPAPRLQTMRPGQFAGTGCVSRSCVTWSGRDIWPSACLPDGGA